MKRYTGSAGVVTSNFWAGDVLLASRRSGNTAELYQATRCEALIASHVDQPDTPRTCFIV